MNDNKEKDVIHGAYLKARKIIKRGSALEQNPKFIKLTEIKIIEAYDEESSVFSTYKDTKYLAIIPTGDLLSAINKFIFKQDDFYYEYVESN